MIAWIRTDDGTMDRNMADRIAVVDDAAMSLKIVKRVLDRAGIEGRYFRSGAEFYTILQ